MAMTKTMKAPAKAQTQAKQLDISDRALMGIIFSVIMGFVAIVFFQLKADVNQTRTELKTDINQVRTELKADFKSEINRLETRIDKIDSKLDQILLRLGSRRK